MKPIDIDLAEIILDPQAGTLDYETAAKVLAGYSPFTSSQLSAQDKRRAGTIWKRIAQHRLGSSDPKTKQTALEILQSGDPFAVRGQLIEDIIPDDASLVVLDEWPETLPTLRITDRVLSRMRNYPSRAIRMGGAGKVDLGLLFKPDGSMQDIVVVRDVVFVKAEGGQRAHTFAPVVKKSVTRYIRPRVSEMTLTGFEGRYAYVPLPSFEFRIVGDRPKSTAEFVDGTIIISGVPYRAY